MKRKRPFPVDPHYVIENKAEHIRRDLDEILFATGMMA
jgi:hypothetical protein